MFLSAFSASSVWTWPNLLGCSVCTLYRHSKCDSPKAMDTLRVIAHNPKCRASFFGHSVTHGQRVFSLSGLTLFTVCSQEKKEDFERTMALHSYKQGNDIKLLILKVKVLICNRACTVCVFPGSDIRQADQYTDHWVQGAGGFLQRHTSTSSAGTSRLLPLFALRSKSPGSLTKTCPETMETFSATCWDYFVFLHWFSFQGLHTVSM